MRSDMSKVIVERPRLRIPRRNGSLYPRGRLKNRWMPSLEDAPRTEPMGGTYAEKWLNENLQPLVRFLRSRVGRLWSEVHSEIAAQISCKSAVQKHVLDHLRDYVEEHPFVQDGAVARWCWGKLVPLESRGMRLRFYVEPATQQLRLAPIAPRKRRAAEIDPDRRVLSNDEELRRIAGVWYAIRVEPIPEDEAARARCFDVIARAAPIVRGRGRPGDVLWAGGRYAAHKRQLGAREIARNGLRRR